jgi:flagellar hook-basal body complex protein FliE
VTIPTITITPSGAAQAYARVAGEEAGVTGNGFGAALGRALEGVVQAGHNADQQAMTAITGGSNFTDVATAVSQAELALQSAVAIRDKVVQAYQDVMRMAI